MVTYQTSAQHTETIRFGSAKVEVGATVGALTNLGLAEGIEFVEEFKPIVLTPDNAPEITVGVKDHYATVKFNLWEVNLTNLALIRGGIDTLTNTAAASASVVDELHTLSGTTGCRLDHKNGSGEIVTAITVKDSVGTSTILNTDYVLYLDSDGYTCIARTTGSTVITTGETVKVSYTYIPNASITLSSGGLNTISARVVRITNTNSAGKVFRITIYAAKNQGGIELKLPADDADESLAAPIELKGIVDTTRTAGDQLFEIYDEQGVSA